MSDITIKALTPETFDDFAALVERNKGMFASCWCTHFHENVFFKGAWGSEFLFAVLDHEWTG